MRDNLRNGRKVFADVGAEIYQLETPAKLMQRLSSEGRTIPFS
jgi:hypothetical protein